MISKRQKWILWIGFASLFLLSGIGIGFAFEMRGIVPMLLNDACPNFAQLADSDHWDVYHEAQWWFGLVALIMLALAVLWAMLAGTMIWKLSKK